VCLRRTFWKFNDLSVSDVGLSGCPQARVRGKTAMSVGRLLRRTTGPVCGGSVGWLTRPGGQGPAARGCHGFRLGKCVSGTVIGKAVGWAQAHCGSMRAGRHVGTPRCVTERRRKGTRVTFSGRVLGASGGGIYQYVVAGGNDGRSICDGEAERTKLCRLIMEAAGDTRTSERSRFCVHAYCVDDFRLQAVIEAPHPSRLAETLRQVARDGGAVLDVYDSVRLYGVSDLLAATRHCHVSPVDSGLVSDAAAWRSSSHRGYLMMEKVRGLTRSTVTSYLAEGPGGWPFGYRCLMAAPDNGQKNVALWNMDVPVLPISDAPGDGACLGWFKTHHIEHHRDRVFQQSIDDVCGTTECDAEIFRSNPSDSRFQLQRALIVERLTQSKFMTVKEAAQRLGCDRSWSYRTRKHCRARYPEWFNKQ
jgi:hypothetical protein